MVKSSADSLLTVINDILDFSKVEAGKLELDAVDFSLNECVDYAIRPLALKAHQKRLELATDISGNVPDRLVGDTGRLSQCTLTLASTRSTFSQTVAAALCVWASHSGAPAVCHFPWT